MFYEFAQNNSGGRFIVDDKVCHRLLIEADDKYEAVSIAEDLGCYWDGVSDGIDCPCCGDRWDSDCDDIPIDKYSTEGYRVHVYGEICDKTIARWNEKYGKYEQILPPTFEKGFFSKTYSGKIRMRNIEEYAQFMADEYGFTFPDARIYYKDGCVKEIFASEERGESNG